jgi:hypothetical protein
MKLTGKAFGAALLAGALVLFGGAREARAQVVGTAGQFSTQNWSPALDPYGYFTVEGAKAMEFLQIHLALSYNWSHNSVELGQARQGGVTGGNDVVRDLHMIDLTGAIGLVKIKNMGLTLGIDVPYAAYEYGIELEPPAGSTEPASLRKNAFGDLRTQLKWTFLDREADVIGFAVYVNLIWPTGRPDMFLSNGYRLLTPEIGGSIEKKFKYFRIGMNTSYQYFYQDLSVADATISDKWKVAAGAEITPFDSGIMKPFSIVGEYFMWFNMRDPFDHEAECPMEAGGGFKYTSTFFAELGANAGLNYGVGAPDIRLFCTIGVTF